MALMSFDILLNLSLSYHTKRRTGELLRILSRSEAINDFFELLLFSFVPVLIDLPVAFVVISVRYGATIVAVVTFVSAIYVATSVTLAESRTKLYRKLRDESQFMHQLKSDVRASPAYLLPPADDPFCRSSSTGRRPRSSRARRSR